MSQAVLLANNNNNNSAGRRSRSNSWTNNNNNLVVVAKPFASSAAPSVTSHNNNSHNSNHNNEAEVKARNMAFQPVVGLMVETTQATNKGELLVGSGDVVLEQRNTQPSSLSTQGNHNHKEEAGTVATFDSDETYRASPTTTDGEEEEEEDTTTMTSGTEGASWIVPVVSKDNDEDDDDNEEEEEEVAAANANTMIHNNKVASSSNNHNAKQQARITELEGALAAAHLEMERLVEAAESAQQQRNKTLHNLRKKRNELAQMAQDKATLEKELDTACRDKEEMAKDVASLKLGLSKVAVTKDTIKMKLKTKEEMYKEACKDKEALRAQVQSMMRVHDMERELLDHYRKLARHTGFYKWGKPIRALEQQIEEKQQAVGCSPGGSGSFELHSSSFAS